jgi:hypothetical protein
MGALAPLDFRQLIGRRHEPFMRVDSRQSVWRRRRRLVLRSFGALWSPWTGLLLKRRRRRLLRNGRGGENGETGGEGERGETYVHAGQLNRHSRTRKSDFRQTDVIGGAVLRARFTPGGP